jgi:uncharacterized protein (TIGR02466 family)
MPLDAWFPLLVYYNDLVDSAAHKPTLLARIAELRRQSGDQRNSENTAWTGDIHNVERLHCDPAFAWITEQVGIHAWEYLRALGHDLNIVYLHIQRAWPVLSTKSQIVYRHAHHTAHLSAVYYLQVPTQGEGGGLRFHSEFRPNELSGGLAGHNTGAYSQRSYANFQTAIYKPIEGRLMLFPAKQVHSVEPHTSDQTRISMSFDLVLTSRPDHCPGEHEFLMPPPDQWRPVARSKHCSTDCELSGDPPPLSIFETK